MALNIFSSSNSLKMVPRTWFGFSAYQFNVGNLYFDWILRLIVIAPLGAIIEPGGGGIGIVEPDIGLGGAGGGLLVPFIEGIGGAGGGGGTLTALDCCVKDDELPEACKKTNRF